MINAQDEKDALREPIFDIGIIEIPDGDPSDVAEFLQELNQLQKDILADYRAAMTKISSAQSSAANKILSDPDVSDEHFAMAAKFGLSSMVRGVANQTPDRKRQVLEMLKRQLSIAVKQGIQRTHLSNASALVSYLERGGDSQIAGEACEAFVEILKGTDDRDAKSYLSRFEGMSRRLNLLGNPIQLTGKALDGSEFDWSQYKGKVVLIDFWATWCGPCLAEAPNVKKNYDKYHDRGFEVVGISLDTKKSSLENYVKTKKVPWINLFEDNAGWKHPMAVKYGVTAIPSVFLVNRKGNVVSLRARGSELGKQLKQLLETKEDLEREIAECSRKLEETPDDVNLLNRRAEAYLGTEQWELAAADWRTALKRQPNLAAQTMTRFIQAQQWDHAADFAMAAVQQDPDTIQLWLKAAPVFARSGNGEKYRDFSKRLVDQFKDSDDWRECRVTCKACLLLPDSIPLDRLPQEVVAKGFEGKHTPYTLAWSWNARALLAYRNGNAKLALKYLQESEKNQPVAYAKALNLPLFALVHHRLGNDAEAEESLKSAERLIQQLTASETSRYHHDVLIADLILDEAKETLLSKSN